MTHGSENGVYHKSTTDFWCQK